MDKGMEDDFGKLDLAVKSRREIVPPPWQSAARNAGKKNKARHHHR